MADASGLTRLNSARDALLTGLVFRRPSPQVTDSPWPPRTAAVRPGSSDSSVTGPALRHLSPQRPHLTSRHLLKTRLMHTDRARFSLRNMIVVPALLIVTLYAAISAAFDDDPKRPEVGSLAPDFELKTLRDETVKLSELIKSGPVVAIVLRGYPGYQCPVCTQQVGQFLAKADEFATRKTRVVLIYPGNADQLSQRAEQFLGEKSLPENVLFVTDPDYVLTEAWGLRWDEENETAYPATLVVDEQQMIRFAKISKSHGDRSKPADVLKALDARGR